MIAHLRGFRASKWTCLLAILAIAAGPALSEAGWLGFRNDLKLKGGIIVQTGTPVKVANKVGVRWGRPKIMQAGEIAWDVVLQPGLRSVRIFDANQNLLFQDTITCQGNKFISIRSKAGGGVELMEIEAPMTPPGQGAPPKKGGR
jgi:hypothetical protein